MMNDTDNTDAAKVLERMDREFYLLRARLLLDNQLLENFSVAEIFLKYLAVRDFFRSDSGMAQVADLHPESTLILLAESDIYQKICELLPVCGFDVSQAFAAHMAGARM